MRRHREPPNERKLYETGRDREHLTGQQSSWNTAWIEMKLDLVIRKKEHTERIQKWEEDWNNNQVKVREQGWKQKKTREGIVEALINIQSLTGRCSECSEMAKEGIDNGEQE